MKKVLIICLLIFNFLNVWADGEGKAGLQNVVNSSLVKNSVNGFKSLQVNDMFSGAGVYKIDIELPKGIKGDNQNLSINYNSYSTDSFNPYGYAWNINLQPIIRNSKKGIDNLYKNQDFYAEGNDLVLVDSENGIFKQKNSSSLSKYIFENGYWKVIDTSGNTYYYGNTDLAKLDHPTDKSKIFAWYLTKKIDSRGNETIYSYFKDNNQVYLNNIDYVFTDGTPLYSVKFDYLDKKISSTSFRTQFEVKTSKLLSNIKLYVSGELKKQYNFSYDSIQNPFSHLTKVELSADNKIYKSFDFTYGKGKDNHLLTNIKTQNGLNIDFTYKPAVSYKQDGKNLNTKLPFNVKTLSNITYTDLVTNNTLSEDYSYAGGYYYYNNADIYAREYAGFNKVEKKDSLGKTEVFYYHQGQGSYDGTNLGEYQDDINKKGLIYRYELKDNLGNIYNTKIIKWDKKSNSDGTYKIEAIQEVESFKNATTKAKTYTYDNYGQLIEEKYLGLVSLLSQKGDFTDIFGDEKIIQKTYAINIAKNLYNYVSSEKILDKNNNEVSKKEYYYDNLANGELSFGDLTNTKSYVDSIKTIEEKNEYNNKGLLVKSINPKGYITNIIYDSYGLYPSKIINARGYEENYTYDYSVGKPSSFTDVNQVNYTYTYDTLGRNLSSNVNNNGTKSLKSYIYDDISIPNSIKESTYLSTDGNDKVTNYYYLDSLTNPIQTKRKYKDKYITTYMEYDSYGRKTYDYYKKYENAPDFSNNKSTLKGDKYTYDVVNRITNINNSTGDISYEYTDLGFTIYNQKNIATKYSYDIYGNLVEVLESPNTKTNYDYNTLGKLLKITSLGLYERNFTYDMLGRRLKAEELHKIGTNNFKSQYYTYDDNSNLTVKTVLSGNNIVYTYDDLDRLTSSTSSDINVLYKYDEGVNNKTRLTGIDNGSYKERYTYDIYGQLTEDKKIYADKEYTTINEYQFVGIKKSTTFPDNKKVIYNYVEGVVEVISYEGKNLTTNIEYNPNFYIEKLVYGNPNLEEINTYDYQYNYRLLNKTLNKKDTGSNITKLSDISYEYDNIGSIIKSKEIGNKTQFQKEVNYTYDDKNRLLKAQYTNLSSIEEVTYTYDELGNITYNSNKGNYVYNSDIPERLEKVTNLSNTDEIYGYDNNGNITSLQDKNYVYNTRDELTSFNNGTGSLTQYIYDEGGIRVEKKQAGKLNRYINKNYEEETIGTGSGASIKISKYIDLNGKKIATIEKTANTEEKIIYQQEDYLGGASIDLDENLNTLQIVDYYPFGKLRLQDQSTDYKNKYLYSKKERDIENGLDYFEARYYDSEVGRFNSIDRVYWELGETERGQSILRFPQQLNAYSYTSNNPIIYTDVTGEALDTIWDIGNVIYDSAKVVKNGVEATVGAGVVVYGTVTGKQEYVEAGEKGIKQNITELKSATQDLGADATAMAIPFVPAGTQKIVKNAEKAKDVKKVVDKLGSKNNPMKTSDALKKMEKFLGDGYKEVGNGSGRYVSKDGLKQARMGESDITGKHGGGPHINLETKGSDGRTIISNEHIYIKD